ncbi:low molecular weight phosphotyrosine protein phosphatase [Arthrobacter gandavensis]|uniref:low molecular weight protein-tyrosine-phosphatase n=1 Tax=Arthrobacter gandavensis TaxID=169960 RepID=UPI00188E1B64|nr:low molecular weight protein-tyrosine-phosphatase [Arthrobacter gandavensis]MBF4994173.1 low molecular weight phosphotyrosine protein phosphatase [Arthrobacter gandavensis]
MYRIITVCTGNICRSPMAQFCLERALAEAGLGTRAEVDSAGVTGWEAGRPMDPRTAAELRKHGYPEPALDSFRARPFEAEWYGSRDLILALDHGHLAHLQAEAPSGNQDGIRMLRSFDPAAANLSASAQGITDPWYGDMTDFDASYELIQAAVPGVVEYVRAALADRSR